MCMKVKALSKLTSYNHKKPNPNNKVITIAILISLVIIGKFVYFTGGANSNTQLMYIPIIAAIFFYGTKEGILMSILAGIAVGPYMPHRVAENIPQTTAVWVFRTIMFGIVAWLVGALVNHIKISNDSQVKKAYTDLTTGFPNINKLKVDLEEIVKNKLSGYSIIIFEFCNMDIISRYIDHGVGNKSLIKLLEITQEFYNNCKIYTNSNKFVTIVPDCSTEYAYLAARELLNITRMISIDDFPISVRINAGIVFLSNEYVNASEIMIKLDRAIDQANKSNKSIIIYNDDLAAENKIYYETIVTLHHSLENDLYTLAYQPKINIINNKLIGFEALLRWRNSKFDKITISQLIKISEECGFIGEITRWVIKTAVYQLREWKDNGIDTSVSVNLSSRDLSDPLLVEYVKECLRSAAVNPSSLEFEITERTIINYDENAVKIIEELRQLGIKISLDDCGSGYNSMRYLLDYADIIDFIKLDKLFIDTIESYNSMIIVDFMINTVHKIGLELVAEGVETKEQYEILKNMGCDIVQGYYFGRPIDGKLVKEYIDSLNIISEMAI